MSNTDVLFHEMPGKDGDLGIITLNRPAVLNALNYGMIMSMQAQLQKWSASPDIKAVIITASEGRAFCAGGDLRTTYDWYHSKEPKSLNFFQDEYRLNQFIFHFKKPYIALLDGITMGGGAGISITGSHRIATEQFVFAMPETGIGFFPDVSGTYFLPRLPHHIGFYLGLTGARINADQAHFLTLVQHKLKREHLFDLIQVINDTSLGKNPHHTVTHLIQTFEEEKAAIPLFENKNSIDTCFAHDTMEAIFQALTYAQDDFCQETLATLKKKSPTSLKITLRALQLGQALNFDECMQMEYRLAMRFLQGHDFFEGIRAVIVDKDQSPKWNPATLEAVLLPDLKKYFSPLIHELTK